MMGTVAWKELQRLIADHCKSVKQTLAAHMGIRRKKKQELAKTLGDVMQTKHGKWSLSLALPDLYTRGDKATFNITVEGHWRRTTVQDLQTMSTTTSPRT